jgi:hypothetical protein
VSDLWIWTLYQAEPGEGGSPIARTDVTGFDVESRDGHRLGTVDEATYESGGAFLVVDTGFWIFGKRRIVPAGVVVAVDPDARTVTLGVGRDEIKDAPDYDEVRRDEPGYRDEVHGYFSRSSYAGMTGDPLGPTAGTEHV